LLLLIIWRTPWAVDGRRCTRGGGASVPGAGRAAAYVRKAALNGLRGDEAKGRGDGCRGDHEGACAHGVCRSR
jgi:hypothetical protein